MSSDFGVRSAHDVIAELTRRLGETEDRAERAERERDELEDRLKVAEQEAYAAFGQAGRAWSWARRWKRAATHYRDKHLNALTRIGHVKALASGRIRALEARLEKWRTAERLREAKLYQETTVWARVPEGEE